MHNETILDSESGVNGVNGVNSVNSQFIIAFLLPTLFFLSGISALIYQITWLSKLQLLMGHTVYTLSTLLGAYLAGLALGSLYAHKLINKWISPIKLYLIFEFIIGVYAIFFQPILTLVHESYAWPITDRDLSLVSLSIIQFICSFIVIIIPTVLMGATLPLLAEGMYKSNENISRKISFLYGMNTFGAFTGIVLAGYFLLPMFGYQKTIYIASSINFTLFILAFTFIENISLPNKEEWKNFFRSIVDSFSNQENKGNHFKLSFQEKTLVFSFFTSGMTSVLLQLLWNRMSSLNYGASVYIFPLVTGLVLLGISLGSALTHFLKKKNIVSEKLLSLFFLLSAFSILIGNYFYSRVPLTVLYWHQRWNELSHPLYTFLQWGLSFCILGPACIFIGCLFPIGLTLFIKNVNSGALLIGRGYFYNIMGTLIGSILGSFVLIPSVGIEGLGLFVVVALIVQSAAITYGNQRQIVVTIGTLCVGVLAFLVFPRFDKSLMVSGYFYNREDTKLLKNLSYLGYYSLESYEKIKRQQLIDYRDDPHATISIDGIAPEYSFRNNGKIDGSTNVVDGVTNFAVAQLPLLHRSDYQDVLIVGLGTGQTANEVTYFPFMRSSKVIELSSAMIYFAQNYFNSNSKKIWTDPRFSIINRDGREFLLHTKKKFDLIISEPSNPWVDGVSSLYTKDFFQQVSLHLNPKGVASIWFHSYNLDCSGVYSVFMAMKNVFPHFKIFKIETDFFAVVSNDTPIEVDHLPPAQQDLEKRIYQSITRNKTWDDKNIFSEKWWERYIYVEQSEDLELYKKFALVNTDDNQYLQYHSGKTFYRNIRCEDIYGPTQILKLTDGHCAYFSYHYPPRFIQYTRNNSTDCSTSGAAN
ncbi:MAG: hypothetical protein HQK53_11350 [Oligoflexia bacterium]|nr:hypothetical protein [Oligoflexia bacterium]